MKHKSFLVVLLVLIPLVACNVQESNEPSYLNVSLSGETIMADQTAITVTVECDKEWKATLANDADWSSIKDIKHDGNNGTVTVALLFNKTDDTRSNTLVVTSGQKSVETPFSQTGLKDFFQPGQISLTGKQESSVSFIASADWAATVQEGKEWITLKTASGKAGESRITCEAKSELYESESRSGVIRFSHSDQYIDIPVVQGQTDIIEVEDGQKLSFNFQSQTFEIRTRFNVAYKVSVSDPSWIQHVSTKAIGTATEEFALTANESTESRSGHIKLECEDNPDVSITVNLVQKGMDPILLDKTCGLYGLGGYDVIHGDLGWNQISWAILPNESSVFRLLNANALAAVLVSDIPQSLETGEQCQLNVKILKKGNVIFVSSYTFVLVYEKDGMRWLRNANDDDMYLIIK